MNYYYQAAWSAGLMFALSVTGTVAADTAMPHRADLSPEDQARVAAITRPATDFSGPEAFEDMPAGAATSTAPVNANAFSHFSANLDFKGEQDFKLGNGLFRKLWVSSPASTQASDGLGPLFNARSCQRCHLKDGRGHPPAGDKDNATSMFLRLSVPPRTPAEQQAIDSGAQALIPEPTYGEQLQDMAVPGVPAEGRMTITYAPVPVMLDSGETVTLRRPTYGIADPGYGPLSPHVLISPRVSPQMIGLGLIEAIHPGDIRRQADPADRDGDGISGRISEVTNPQTGEKRLGLFGWKASQPDIRRQSANAFAGDIGISSPMAPRHWGDCTVNQPACLEGPTGVQDRLGDTEAPDPVLDLVTFYARNLAVPARRNTGDANVLRGKEIFYAAGCADCHTPKYVTRRDAPQKEHRFQLIWPYTDMLLHDMGEGLADNRPDGSANGREWRTAPLWGIGLTETVNGHSFFLHDGRARNLLEAILWHGGEAAPSRNTVVGLSKPERDALLAFLNSL
jgi:CxxC motif-containing protein (DUF1111 family)